MSSQDLLEGAGLGLGAPDKGRRIGWAGKWAHPQETEPYSVGGRFIE
ncbi:MAG: hypothetical protein ACI87O_002133 [Planctomycetota bacterium]|jgi:hypothetical protein